MYLKFSTNKHLFKKINKELLVKSIIVKPLYLGLESQGLLKSVDKCLGFSAGTLGFAAVIR